MTATDHARVARQAASSGLSISEYLYERTFPLGDRNHEKGELEAA